MLAPPPLRAVRRGAGLPGLERCLQRSGFPLVAGTDEAGRGPSAGPLVVAAVVLPPGRAGEVRDLADSKLLSAAVREEVYARVVRKALAWSVVVVPAAEVDARGIHVVNLEGMRRAVAALDPAPSYVLSDGFPLPGTGRPTLAVPKGDRVAACVAAASVVAKVTRDRLMVEADARHPGYGFAEHKGYTTPEHTEALARLGPCPEHRWSWVTVRRGGGAVRGRSGRWEDGRVGRTEQARRTEEVR